MNLAKSFFRASRCFLLCVLFVCGGCFRSLEVSTPEQLAEFNNAGPIQPEVDLNRLVHLSSNLGVYRLVPGDLLELGIPLCLQSSLSQSSDSYNYGRTRIDEVQPFKCRVREDGKIHIPIAGEIEAIGCTLTELEDKIINAYYPKYSKEKPSIVAQVLEYEKIKVAITGGVANPGVYELRNDQRSLISLIMESGGIIEDGATVIYVDQETEEPAEEISTVEEIVKDQESHEPAQNLLEDGNIQIVFKPVDEESPMGTLLVHEDDILVYSEDLDITDEASRRSFAMNLTDIDPNVAEAIKPPLSRLAEIIEPGSGDVVAVEEEVEGVEEKQVAMVKKRVPLVLPVKGLNIPFADVALSNGCRVEVERLDPAVFTVVGLVERPGAFPYPSNTKYNLMQALAFAGGVDEIADPRYVRVYRQTADGRMVDATFSITGKSLVGAPTVTIKPGDIIAVEQTGRTLRNLLLAEMISFRATASYQIFDGQDFRRTD